MIINALYPPNLAENYDIVSMAFRQSTYDARFVEFNYELADQIFKAGLTDIDFIQVLIIMRWARRIVYAAGLDGKLMIELLPIFWTKEAINVS